VVGEPYLEDGIPHTEMLRPPYRVAPPCVGALIL
jgi:hypothetical protein